MAVHPFLHLLYLPHLQRFKLQTNMPIVKPAETVVESSSSPSTKTITMNRTQYEQFTAHKSASSTATASTTTTGSILSTSSSHDKSYIIGSYAFRHLCANPNDFSSLHKYTPLGYVQLANGSLYFIVGERNISLTSNLCVQRMLHTLTFAKICYQSDYKKT